MSSYKIIHKADYGNTDKNFHVTKIDTSLSVELTYPPRTDEEAQQTNQCRYIEINQESVRASDGIRVYYDYDRDGFVIEQPMQRDVIEGDYITTKESWEEVGFYRSWNLRIPLDITTLHKSGETPLTESEVQALVVEKLMFLDE